MATNATAKEPIVEVKTDYGVIKIKLYNETPKHRDNFLKLAREGFYNGLLFHRIIKEFMIQGGDPESKNAPASKQLGAGDNGYTIPAEFTYPLHYHKKGALAAARTGDAVNPTKASSGCQFYIVEGKKYTDSDLTRIEQSKKNQAMQKAFYMLKNKHLAEIKLMMQNKDQEGLQNLQNQLISEADSIASSDSASYTMPEQMRKDYKEIGGTPFLDGDYTVFGEVVEGMDVIDKIGAVDTDANDRPLKDIKMKVTVEE